MSKYIFLLLISAGIISAQNLDSLYNQLRLIHSDADHRHSELTYEENIKCGFGTVANVRATLSQFSNQKQYEILSILSRPATQKSIVSPSGFFRIHYDETGTNAIGYDVNELAAALDSSYNFEVNKLGFLPPPSDNGLGGDNLYDIYVQNLGAGTYGYTDPETLINEEKGYYSSYMFIDNDFGSDFPTNGIDAAKVTAAHEFHHAIQIGNYSSNYNDLFYFEITSTAMEEFVFDEVNDYYYYLPSYFADPSKRFYYVQGSNAGYNRAIWNIFLSKKFDYDIIKSIWEKMRNTRAIESIASAIGDRGSSFKMIFNEFATWIWFTGSRAVPNQFFEEALFYPQVTPKASYQLRNTSVSLGAEHTANDFLIFSNQTDSLVVIVSECDINSAVNSPGSQTSYQLNLTTSTESGDIKINENYFASYSLEGNNTGMFETSSILNNRLVDGETEITELEFPYPQPFNYLKHSNIFIPVSSESKNSAELYVYSSDMNLVFSGSLNVFLINNALLRWDGKDNKGNKLPTGVYYFVTNSNEKIKKGKLVIINE